TLFEDIETRAIAQNKTDFGSVTPEEWPQITREIQAQALDFLKFSRHNKKFDGLRILNTPYENRSKREKDIACVLLNEYPEIIHQVRRRKEDYLQSRGIQEGQLIVEDWEQICDFPLERLQELEERRRKGEEAKRERERRRRGEGKEPEEIKYDLEIIGEGRISRGLYILPPMDPQLKNIVHLWFGDEDTQTVFWVGYLQNHTGEFLSVGKRLIQQYGIEKDKHFRIVKLMD
ncbi:MAG: hypothetical protein ACFFC6_18370, partial [Promethearchaeota archaeon]